jgi:hypothetical protein
MYNIIGYYPDELPDDIKYYEDFDYDDLLKKERGIENLTVADLAGMLDDL